MADITPRILLVDDEPENLRALERTLRGRFEIVSCNSAQEALGRIQSEDFAVVISDQRMPGIVGTEFLAQVAKERPMTTRIILTAYTETKEILDAINRAEIYRYITKPWDNQELMATVAQAAEHHALLRENRALIERLEKMNRDLETTVAQRTAELQKANARLSDLAMTDPLTKVLNRRAFFGRFHEEIERANRYERAGVVVMIDVDHFKSFNDMEGHVYGDEALKKWRKFS